MPDDIRRERLETRVQQGGNYFAAPKTNLQFIPTGSKVLDLAIGGGWPERRVSNIVGDKSSGKTLLAIEACCNFAIKYPKGEILYREREHAFDVDYAEALGAPIKRIDFGQPIRTVEDFFDDLWQITGDRKRPKLYILDSLDALSDEEELKRAIDKGSYGVAKAKQMSELFRRLIDELDYSNTTLIIISQIRNKIGVTFGRMSERSGGKALDFYASVVVWLAQLARKKKTIEKIERVIGIDVKAKIDKNKVSLPFREAEFPILFGYGIDDVQSCLDWAAAHGVIGDILRGQEEAKFKRLFANEARPDLIEHMHDVIERRWYEVENKFLPQRRKYGG